jgi:O-antigen ligase
MNSLTLGFLKRATLFFFYIYVIALTCSMAGMEITSWSAAFFFLLYFVSSLSIVRGEAARLPDCDRVNIYSTGIELIFFLFIAVVTLGLTLNGPQEDFIFSIGMLRNFALFFFFVYILQFVKNISKIFTIIGICATVIAVYGIWQHFTGIDLWRHNNRALVLIPDSAKLQYATVGFFNHHLTYGHSYMMILCLPWAALLLWNQKKIGWGRLSLALVSFSLILTSLIYTYGRGVWLAILITIPLMTFIVSRRIFVVVAVAISLFAGVLLKYDLDFRGRALSIFAEKYKSNDERVKLWEANVAMFKDHPLIGVGYHQNEALSMHYYQKLGIQSGMAGHAHNNYIQILSTTGMCGFILYLIFINFFLIQTIRLYFAIPKDKTEDRIFALAAIGAQLVFHIGGFTQWNFGDMKVQHQYFFWLAAVTYMCHRYKVETHLQHRLLSAIGTSISTTFKKIRPWVSDPYTLAVGLFSFIMVFMKKWEPGGNLDTIWYSSVAKNIALTGNYFHFYISKYYFREIFDHMPMTYWIVGTILRIFGPSDLAARIYPMICSFLSYVLIYKIGSKIKNKEFGLLALVVHALCFGASKWNGAVMHDVPLTTFYLASFYFFILGLEQAKYFYLTALFFAFGVFTKGPIIFGFFLGLVLW